MNRILLGKAQGRYCTGSANGMSINLLGLEEGFDIPLAVLNTIKGESQRANHGRLSIELNQLVLIFQVRSCPLIYAR